MKAVTREAVHAYQEKYGCGIETAKRGVAHQNAMEAIESATTVEDLKGVLLFLLETK
jgi:hypothetical protein